MHLFPLLNAPRGAPYTMLVCARFYKNRRSAALDVPQSANRRRPNNNSGGPRCRESVASGGRGAVSVAAEVRRRARKESAGEEGD